jgi:DNA polymerase-3 subunit delta
MARTPTAAQVLGHVVLVTGKEEFLSERTVVSVRQAVRRHDPEAELAESPAIDLTLATLGEMSAPSLFTATRCVVVRNLEDLPEESVAGLLDYCTAPVEDVALVLVHSGGQRGSGVLTKLRKLPAVTEVKSEEVKPSALTQFVDSEVGSHGAAAADQLTSDFPGEQLTVETVQRYFGGRAEAKSFSVADSAFAGKRAMALEELRWAMDTGTPAVLVTSAMAGSARSLARYLGAGRGCARPTWRASSACRRGRSAPSGTSPGRGAPTPSRPRCRRWRSQTPTSRAAPTTRRTRSSGWC